MVRVNVRGHSEEMMTEDEVRIVQTIQLPINQPSDSHMENCIRMRNAELKQDRFFFF